MSVAKVVAAFLTGVEGAIRYQATEGDGNPLFDIVAATVWLGLMGSALVLPVFLGAFAVGRAAARRSEDGRLALRLMLLVTAPVVALPWALALPLPELLTYLAVLYGVGYATVRDTFPRIAERSREATSDRMAAPDVTEERHVS